MSRIAHVNLMIDTIIANLEVDSMRAVIRSMLAEDVSGDLTRTLVDHSRRHVQSSLQRQLPKPIPAFFTRGPAHPTTPLPLEHEGEPASQDTPDKRAPRVEQISTTPALSVKRREAMVALGCGLAFESVSLYTPIVEQVREVTSTGYMNHDEEVNEDGKRTRERKECFDEGSEDILYDEFAAIDCEMVQVLTAVQKVITSNMCGKQQLLATQRSAVKGLQDALQKCSLQCEKNDREFMFERGKMMIDQLGVQG